MCGIRRHKGRKTFILVKRITVKITKNIYYFFRYAYRFNLQIHTQVAPAREGGGPPPRPQTPRRPRSAPSAGAGWSGRRDRPHGGTEESETPGKDGPGGNGPEEIRRKRQQDPEFFVIFGSYGRSLLPYSLLQARLRLLRLLQERRTGPHGAARGGDAPRTRSAPRLSGRRTCPHALFRGRHAVALSAGDDRRAAGPCRGAARLLGRRGDDPRSQPRRPHAGIPGGAPPDRHRPPLDRHTVLRRRVSEADEPPPQRCASRRGRGKPGSGT